MTSAHDVDDDPDPDPADLVAEIDDDPDLDADSGAEPDTIATAYAGRCTGGPWDGRTVASRFPKGILVVAREEQTVWIYDRDEGGGYRARSADGYALDDVRRWDAADSGDYDIIAVDAEIDAGDGQSGESDDG